METMFVVFAEKNCNENFTYGIVGFDRGYLTFTELLKALINYLRTEEDFDPNVIIEFSFDYKDSVTIAFPLSDNVHFRERPLNEFERQTFFDEIKYLS